MVQHHWNQDELKDYLEVNGCRVINRSYRDALVYEGPSGKILPIKVYKSYYHRTIVNICNGLDVEPPAIFIKICKEFDDLKEACKKFSAGHQKENL